MACVLAGGKRTSRNFRLILDFVCQVIREHPHCVVHAVSLAFVGKINLPALNVVLRQTFVLLLRTSFPWETTNPISGK